MEFDVIIIGAGPAGTCAASMLFNQGLKPIIIEKSSFPRFSIGESLLPQNMVFYEEAGLSKIFKENDFTYKDGAQFYWANEVQEILFENKSANGPSTTFQVQRDIFDQKITEKLSEKGVDIFFDTELIKVDISNFVIAKIKNPQEEKTIKAKFIIDASGFARVLPKVLKLSTSYNAQNRYSVFSHIKTKSCAGFDTDKILISIDQVERSTWYWTIPLTKNKYSLGVITEEDPSEKDLEKLLIDFIKRNPKVEEALNDYSFLIPPKKIQSFTSQTERIYGNKFVLLGNSGEFLDPIFSSGITIALKSASLATPLITKELKGEKVNWEEEYFTPLNYGIKTFHAFVEAWYNGKLQDIIYAKKIDPKIRSHIISILAGYAWDEENPFTKKSKERLIALHEFIHLLN